MGDTETKTTQNTPVYLSFKTFQSAIANLREHGLPDKLDRSAWSSRSGIDQTQILSAFRFLGFVDQQTNTQQALRDLVGVSENSDEEKKLLHAILQERYEKVFKLDLRTATPMQFSEAIGSYGAAGTTRDRSVRFFIKAANHCGVELSQRLKKAIGPTSRSTSAAGKQNRPGATKGNGGSLESLPTDAATKTIMLPKAEGGLTISGTFNWFKLVGEERDLVLSIIDKMTKFESKEQEQE